MILGWLLHVVYSTLIAYALANLAGQLSPWIAVVSLLLGTLLAVYHARRIGLKFPDWRIGHFRRGDSGLLELALFVFITYAGYRHFIWMFYPSEHNWFTLSLNNYGDLALHINFIRAIANGISFPLHNPIFASDLLRYPYGIDLYNALFEQLGMRLQGHLFLVGLFGTVASLVMVRAYAGWIGMGAFFLSGGFAGWQVLQGSPLRDFQSTVDWKNLFLTVFITQRGFLVALPLGLMLILAVRKDCETRASAAALTRGQLMTFGAAWGFLPLFHLHAFIAVSLLMAGVVYEFGGWPAVLRFLRSPMALVAYAPALFFILFSTHFLGSASIARIEFGWMAKGPEWPLYILQNFGPWLFVPAVIAFLLARGQNRWSPETRRALWIEFAVYSILFLLFFNVMLAPWAWDNIKLLIWPYLGFARLLWLTLDDRLGFVLGSFERPIIALVLFLSGLVAVIFTLQTPPLAKAAPLYSFGDLASFDGALSGIGPNAVFAAAPSHLHPLTFFGRMRAVGYEGHLWSHGIDARAAVDKLNRIMKGDADTVALARELGVTHIVWGPDERLLYGVDERPWMKTLKNVSRVPGYAVYAIQ